MINSLRAPIYSYVYNLFYNTVTKQVHPIEIPTTLDTMDATDFMVIRMGQINDKGEFSLEGYADTRVFIEMYVKSKTRGRIDMTAFGSFESKIQVIIDRESKRRTSPYQVIRDNSISLDDYYQTQNYHVFLTSFIIRINN